MAKHSTELQSFCKGHPRKMSKEEMHRVPEMADEILITKKGKQGLKQGVGGEKVPEHWGPEWSGRQIL